MSQTGNPPPPAGPDWTVEAVDRLEAVVSAVRDKTTVPVTKAARAIVYGLVAAFVGVLALLLLIVAVFRLHVYLPFGSHHEGRKVWVAYLILGAIFLLTGGFLWGKRRRKPER